MQRPMQNMPAFQTPHNPLHTTFKNPNFPANFINESNVLDYFCNPDNIFYDMKSCNQVVRMQHIDRPLLDCLAEMQGDQYVLHSCRPPLFVIMKQRRNAGSVTPLAYYYVINGVVYQCPDAYSLIQSRLLGAVDPLRQAFDHINKFLRFNVAKGYSWQFDTRAAEGKDDEDEDEEDAFPSSSANKKKADDEATYTVPRTSAFQNTRTSNIMQLLYEQFPCPSGLNPFPGTEVANPAPGQEGPSTSAGTSATSAPPSALSGLAAFLPTADGEGANGEQPPTKKNK